MGGKHTNTARRALTTRDRPAEGNPVARPGPAFAAPGPGTQASAIKTHARPDAWRRELAAYRRLAERGVRDVLGHHVPQLLDFDDALLVIEMTIVQRPFLLDFASAWLDGEPDFSEEVLAEWDRQKRDQFEERWPQVARVLAALRRHGVYLQDVHPGNITFGEAES